MEREQNPKLPVTKSFFDIDRAIDNIKHIKSPIQLGAFIFLMITIIVLYSKVTLTFILLFVFALPFLLIIFLFSNKSIAFFKSHNKTGLKILSALIVIVLLFAAVPLYFAFANPSLINTSNILPFSREFALSKADEARKTENLVQNYTENYEQLSKYFFSKLSQVIEDNELTEFSGNNKEIYNKINELSGKISKLKGDNSYTIYGNEDIKKLTAKLQSSITSLHFSKYIFGIIYSCYSSQKNTSINDIIRIDISEFKSYFNNEAIDAEYEWYNLQRVGFSEIETKIIKKLGIELVLKRITDLNIDDVQKIKTAFNEIGIIDQKSLKTDNQIILNNFFKELSQYAEADNIRFYQLATNPQIQFSIYLSMYDIGLIDFNKLILSMCPQKAKKMLEEVLNEELNLFTSKDAIKLKSLIEGELKGKISEVYSKYVLEDGMSNYLKQFDEKNLQSIIEANTVEEYIVEALKYECLQKNLGGNMPIPSSAFLSIDLHFLLREMNMQKVPLVQNIVKQIDNSSDLFNCYKDILVAVNLIESNLINETGE